MKPAEILSALGASDGLPVEAMRAARERRAEMAPVFIREIEAFVGRGPDDAFEPMALFFMVHLLGEWREQAAYRPLCRLMRTDSEILDEVLGDATTETAHRVMEAVFDGDPRPLYEVILDSNADQFIRARMCEVLAMLVLRGTLDRADAARFLRDGFVNVRPQKESFVWDGWWCATAMLGLEEHRSLVKKVFDRRFVHPMWAKFDHFETELRRWRDPKYASDQLDQGEYAVFDDAIGELSRWAGFSKKPDETPAADDGFDAAVHDALHLARDAGAFSEPAVNAYRNVGRNDPCPCGSGKKFKKCCLPGLSPWGTLTR